MQHLAVLAHEIRNPLAAIRNAAGILCEHDAPVRAVAQARTIIDRQLNLIMRLVDELLHGARSAVTNLAMRKERVDLAEIVHLAVEACQPLIDAGGHRLTIRLPSDSVPLEADATRLAQVLVNLLDNAAQVRALAASLWYGYLLNDAGEATRTRGRPATHSSRCGSPRQHGGNGL